MRISVRRAFSRNLALLLPLAGVFAVPAASAQLIPIASCVEYPAGQFGSFYVARFSSLNEYTSSVYIPYNTQLNSFSPFQPKVAPSTFPTGFISQFVSVKVTAGYDLTWRLDGYNAVINSLDGYTSTGAPAVAPICPILLVPATLKYTTAGTYNNVYLAQVNSAPGAGITSTVQPSPGITVSNLVYTPNDAASPITTAAPYEPNPNSVYGTVTIAPGAAAASSIALAVNLNGVTAAQTIIPLSFTPPAFSISGSAVNAEQAGAPLSTAENTTLPISVILNYTGVTAPTGAISMQVDGTSYNLSGQSCQFKAGASSSHQNCEITYSAPNTAGTHTFTFSQAADANYTAFTGSATLTVTGQATASK